MSNHFVTGNVAGFKTGSYDFTYIAAGAAVNGLIDMSYMSDDVTPGGGGHETMDVFGGVAGGISDQAVGSGDDHVAIGASGSIAAAGFGNTAIGLYGGDNTVVNAGMVTATDSAAINIYGGGGIDTTYRDTVSNSGVIAMSFNTNTSGGGAVNFYFVAAADLDNSGSILASGANSGVYLYATGNGSTISNSGLITNGISVAAGSVSIDNTGAIKGAITLNGAGSAIVNDGIINGDVSLAGAGSVLNSTFGKVRGTITCGAGGDKVIAGLGGGTVIGGAGADTLIANLNAAPDSQTTLDGGAGHDKLYGGGGADTFVFRSFAAADRDTIRRFDVANDTIQLDHTVFTTLAAGKTPVFAIGTKATSASDHLFYNSTTGNLYYDADGSGAGKASLLANLTPGLKLTASDFSVV